MKQILHIFAKDVRCFLPEILIVLSLAAAQVSIQSYLWVFKTQLSSRGIWAGGGLPTLLPLFIELAWFLLVCRVIQGERLAGDKQFWVTRPYEWKKLLAAKLLFVLTFVYLPFIVAYFIIRIESGASQHLDVATSFLGALGDMLLGNTVLVLLAACIATVTTNFVSMMGGIFCAFISGIVLTMLPNALRPDSVAGTLSGNICWGVLLVICCAVILLQYARRKTRLSIALLIAIPVLISAILIFTPERHPPDRSQPYHAPVTGPK